MVAWGASWHVGGAVSPAGVVGAGPDGGPRRCARCIRPMWRAGPGSSPPTAMPWCRSISARRALPPKGEGLAALAGTWPRGGRRAAGLRAGGPAPLPPLFGSYRADLYQAERVSELAAPPLIRGAFPGWISGWRRP